MSQSNISLNCYLVAGDCAYSLFQYPKQNTQVNRKKYDYPIGSVNSSQKTLVTRLKKHPHQFRRLGKAQPETPEGSFYAESDSDVRFLGPDGAGQDNVLGTAEIVADGELR
jgi:hypothetical protein